MRKSLALFNSNIAEARNLSGLYAYLSHSISVPNAFDDLLRSQIVYSVSAFDKLIHDLIRNGMVEIFLGKRTATAKYLSESIPLQIHAEIISATIPPKEHIFEQAIFQKLKVVSYQDPDKVAEGLSYIWGEQYKWQKIASGMTLNDKVAKQTLKLIADKRNAIVHEADIDPTTNAKFPTSQTETDNIVNFLDNCGNTIAGLVI